MNTFFLSIPDSRQLVAEEKNDAAHALVELRGDWEAKYLVSKESSVNSIQDSIAVRDWETDRGNLKKQSKFHVSASGGFGWRSTAVRLRETLFFSHLPIGSKSTL